MNLRCRSVALACSALLVLGACGSSSKSASVNDGTAPRTLGPASTAAAASATSSGGAPAAGGVTAGQTSSADASPDALEHKVVITITLEVEVADVAAAADRVQTLTEGVGGRVFSQQTSLGDQPTSTLVLKVPPDRSSGLLGLLATIGKVRSRTQQSDDVTAQFVDLDARITAARASVERVRGFLDKATTVTDLTSIEGELTRRQTELEQLIGQQRVLSSKVDLATITMVLNPTEAALAKPVKRDPSVGHALRKGSHALAVFAHWIALIAAFLLPWLAPAAVVSSAVWALARRHRRRRADRSLPPPVA